MLFDTSIVFITITQQLFHNFFIILKSVIDVQLVLFLVSMFLSPPEGHQCLKIIMYIRFIYY